MTATVPPARTAPTMTLSPLGIFAGMSGNLMEWYDFALYGVMATTLGELFFPHGSRLAALLSVFGVFAAGYVMRLLGGALFGHVGDRLGRRRALLVSAVAMAVATTLVGCLPTYAAIGVAAPVLFTLLRLVQGLSVGGEFTTSITYLIEHAPPSRRALQGSFAGLTAGLGILLGSAIANALFALFTTEEILEWAWRLPFLLSVPLGLCLAILRSTLPEDGPAEAASARAGAEAEAPSSPVWRVLREHPGEVVRGALLGFGPNASFYAIAVFLASFLATEHILPETSALSLETASIAWMVVLTPIAGALADRIGRRKMVLTGVVGCGLLGVPLFALLHGSTAVGDLWAELLFATFVVAALPPYQVWLAERFPRDLRASGLGLAYNGAAGILGGTTPLVCATLADATGSELAPGAYVAFACLVSLVVALRTPETGGDHLA
ncbi:MAG: MHS family MFS transporter [Deltaproteobacteria bacterium]|nr:MHS family MFS transporter [Deltaproteobacteria bacterium]